MTASTRARPTLLPETAEDDGSRLGPIVAAIQDSIGDVPVILCGSRATGTHAPLSDYDILVVLPWRRMPFAIKTLRALSARLTDKLGAPVTVNPLPERTVRRQVNLFLWKVAHEGRVLSSPPGFALPRVTRPPYDDSVRFSYLTSALQALLRGVDGDTRRREDAVHKALLMLAQIRLLEHGCYSLTLDEALVALGSEGEDLHGIRESPNSWTRTCSKVLAELATVSSPPPATALLVNARYALLALLRGRRRLRSALSLRAIDRRLSDTAALLAGALADRTAANHKTIQIIHQSLPRSLRRPTTPTWEDIRALLEQEWPDAHPLTAQ